jgi:hypothetical protein
MRWHDWFRNGRGYAPPRFVSSTQPPGRRRLRPALEQFEDRELLSSYTASSVTALVADIKAANKSGGTNAITLAMSTTFDLTKADNATDGPTGLPVIANADSLTITGLGGDTIQRDASAPDFRLFDVASGGALTLQNLTLQNGLTFGSGSSAEGGAIYNQGSLVLSALTVQNNLAQGANGADARGSNRNGGTGGAASGGGIYSSGAALTLENGTVVQNNEALGGNGGNAANIGIAGYGGNAQGGGVFVSAGTVTLMNSMVDSNVAQGGSCGTGASRDISNGAGFGGGIFIGGGTVSLTSITVDNNHGYSGHGLGFVGLSSGGGFAIWGGTVTMCSDSVQSNTALQGGGIDIYAGTVYIDSSTVTNTTNNTPDNIEGTYVLQNC